VAHVPGFHSENLLRIPFRCAMLSSLPNKGSTVKYSKKYQPTEARDENGKSRGMFASPFLAKAREEYEVNKGTTKGGWTFTKTTDPRD
jgi:hypothetical protein